MNTPAKLGVFAAALAAVFGAAVGIGAAVGPIDVGDSGNHGSMSDNTEAPGSATAVPRGLSVEASGFRLVLGASRIDDGVATTFTFQIVDADGAATTDFDLLHERPLHMIVLNRDLVEYHHLHPTLAPDGTWSVDLASLPAGSYRVFADVEPAGSDNITLGADLLVGGSANATELPPPSEVFEDDGLTVTLDGHPQVGDSVLSFTVARGGETISTEPYLGALGHLVAIRAADLAFLHVHPLGGSQGPVSFTGEFPTAGVYRLFFDFSVDGVVRTASFTIDAGGMAGMDDGGADHGH